MAITDAMKPDNPIRTAMDRATDAVGGAAKRFLDRSNTKEEEPFLLANDMALGTRPRLSRVRVKVEILAYIDSQFRQRTQTDGTVLAPSREQLVEDLTNLVLDMESKLLDEHDMAMPDGVVNVKRPAHNREPVKSE